MSPTMTNSNRRQRTRGQTIILGCVSLLMMSLMMMASYSVGNAVHQKIALQSQADAEAYSLAVTEARYFNVMAHYNRAIVGTLVAQMSLHAWMAIATGDVDQLYDGVAIMAEIQLFEVAEGCKMIAPWVPDPRAVIHCPHLVVAIWDMGEFFFDAWDWSDKLDNIESKFNDGVEAIDKANQLLSKMQNVVIAKASLELAGTGGVANDLKRNAPQASNTVAVMALNELQYACTFEGSVVDSACLNVPSPMNPYRARASTADRSKVIAAAANAARPLFDDGSIAGLAATAISVGLYAGDFNNNTKEASSNITSGKWELFPPQSLQGHIGESGITVFNLPPYGPKDNKNDEAKNAASGGSGLGWVKNWFTHGHAPYNPLPYGGGVMSDSGGGDHAGWYFLSPSAQHAKFKGNTVSDPCGGGSCFINYRAPTKSVNDDYNVGQPSVYSGVSGSLRVYDTKAAAKAAKSVSAAGDTPAWELNKAGKVEVNFVQGQTATVNYLARGEGHAVAKAKVYFHQLGDWTVPPNFFDPFWRAKLDTFQSRAELDAVLALEGDASSITMFAPYEGQGF